MAKLISSLNFYWQNYRAHKHGQKQDSISKSVKAVEAVAVVSGKLFFFSPIHQTLNGCPEPEGNGIKVNLFHLANCTQKSKYCQSVFTQIKRKKEVQNNKRWRTK